MSSTRIGRPVLAWVAGAVMGAAGAAIGLRSADSPPPTPPARVAAPTAAPEAQRCPDAPAGPARPDRLERCLRELADLRGSGEAPGPSARPDAPAQERADGGSPRRHRGSDRIEAILARFDEERLRSAGFSDRDIEGLGEQILRLEREADFEREAAQRRGATVTRQTEERLTERIWQELRADYGDETYDTLLYATHQNNRAQVQDVLPGSPAQAAGLQPGDVILYYDRARIFGTGELRQATQESSTASGRPRGSVLVEVSRDGERLSLFLPAGRMGVRVVGRSMAPGEG